MICLCSLCKERERASSAKAPRYYRTELSGFPIAWVGSYPIVARINLEIPEGPHYEMTKEAWEKLIVILRLLSEADWPSQTEIFKKNDTEQFS